MAGHDHRRRDREARAALAGRRGERRGLARRGPRRDRPEEPRGEPGRLDVRVARRIAVDLREAQLAPDAHLKVNTLFGGIAAHPRRLAGRVEGEGALRRRRREGARRERSRGTHADARGHGALRRDRGRREALTADAALEKAAAQVRGRPVPRLASRAPRPRARSAHGRHDPRDGGAPPPAARPPLAAVRGDGEEPPPHHRRARRRRRAPAGEVADEHEPSPRSSPSARAPATSSSSGRSSPSARRSGCSRPPADVTHGTRVYLDALVAELKDAGVVIGTSSSRPSTTCSPRSRARAARPPA